MKKGSKTRVIQRLVESDGNIVRGIDTDAKVNVIGSENVIGIAFVIEFVKKQPRFRAKLGTGMPKHEISFTIGEGE